ncbi:MAG: hypothetical protein HC871_02760 [Rhizobiales bacterium]|nr:hypothetical protein [Hyphomicrobiales bacterium]
MAHDSDKIVGKSSNAEMQEGSGDEIDAKLRLLGDAFLDDDIPAALLDVLRLAASARPSPADHAQGHGQSPDAGDDQGDRDPQD